MNYKIRIESLKESNEFLRCLWAIFEKEFGKCAWQFMPQKIGAERKVFFGFMDIGLKTVFEVSIIYHKKGCIEELILVPDSSIEEFEIKKVHECIKQASNPNTFKKSYFKVNATIKNYNRILRYEGQHFLIEPSENERCSTITFNVSAFNQSQAIEVIKQKLQVLINLLSVETKSIYTFRLDEKNKHLELDMSEEIYLSSPENITEEESFEYSIKNQKFNKISKEFKQYIDKFLDPHFIMTENNDLFFRACAHYHTAKKMYENSIYKNPILTSLIGDNFEEISLTTYMSALEVLTLKDHNVSKCSECQQSIFSIKQRVKSVINKNYGEVLAKVFGEYYDNRSKYLHAGITFIGAPRSVVSIPTLSLDHSSGCNVNFAMNLDILDEVVSDILRKEYLLLL